MSQTKFKTAVPVIALIGRRFGLYILGILGTVTAKAGQFAPSPLLS
jgi:hypothetical protein